MKCPKCNSKMKKEYKYCYSCGINVREYNDKKRLVSDIRASIFLGIVSMALVTGYPAIQYFKETTTFVPLKTFFSNNSVETILCSDENNDYKVDYDLKYKDNDLKNYSIDYSFKNTESYDEYKNKLSKFNFETGMNIVANDITNQISYTVDTISIVNDEIYDFNEIKTNYNEMKKSDKCK